MARSYPFSISSGLSIIPEVSGSNNLGSASYPFNQEFVKTSVITTISGTNLNATNLSSSIALASGVNITCLNSGTNSIGTAAAPFSGMFFNQVNTYQVVVQKFNEIPYGLINSSNASYTLAYSPYNFSLQLIKNGIYLIPSGIGAPTFDYTISGSTITMASAPISGATLLANYTYLG